MANVYIRSGGNNGAWTGTVASVATAASTDAAGDVLYVASDHNESNGAAQTWAFAGINASPTKVICGTTAAAPPTTISEAGVCTTTGAFGFSISGNVYVYGLTLNCGTGGVNASISMDIPATSSNVQQLYEKCKLKLVATGTASAFVIGQTANNYPSKVTWKNTDISFANASQKISINMGEFIWDGGSILSGSTAITGGMINSISSGEYAKFRVSGVDLSLLGSASYLCSASGGGTVDGFFRNCKLPTSWTGGLITGTINARDRVSMYNCSSADTTYELFIADYTGNISHEDVIVRTGGAGISWKMVSSANAEYPHLTLNTDESVRWNTTTGSAITATIEIITDDVTLKDDEIWVEAQYLGTSGVPLGVFANDAKANILATAANQTTSSETWTTTGLTTPVKQKLSVTFTPQEQGYIHAVVKLAKASTTVYVDPKITIT